MNENKQQINRNLCQLLQKWHEIPQKMMIIKILQFIQQVQFLSHYLIYIYNLFYIILDILNKFLLFSQIDDKFVIIYIKIILNMGNSQNSQNFNAEQYQRNSGLSMQEVVRIRNVFEQFEPKDGLVQTDAIRRLYRDSYDAPQLNNQIGERETLNFDQFFEIMRASMIEKKRQYPGVDFDDGANENVQYSIHENFNTFVKLNFHFNPKDFLYLNMDFNYFQGSDW
ncbi:hypothetical protein pb186bvf_000542 [Paramecium bursaria]